MKITTVKWIKLGTCLLSLADAVLAYGDKISAIPGLPGSVAHAWPFVLIIAAAIHQGAASMNTKP